MPEATSKLSILVQLKDEASAAMSRLSNEVSDLGGSMNFTGTKAGILAGVLAAISGATLLKGISAFADAEVQMVRFDAILKILPPTLQAYREQILEAANGALRFGFDNENAAFNIARLFQTTGDASFAFQAFQAAMDLARFKGIGLDEATRALILAFQGSTRVLKDLGIEVDEHASKQTVLQSVLNVVGGQAEGYSGIFKGLIGVLRAYTDEVFEALGQPFGEMIEGITSKLIIWVDRQGGINKLLQDHTNLVTAANVALTTLTTTGFIFAATVLVTRLIPALGVMVSSWLLLIPLAILLATIIILNWDKIKNFIVSAVNTIKDAIGTLIDFFERLWESAKKALSVAGSFIGGTADAVGGFIEKFTPFQQGGIVTRPTLGFLGEAGAEAVVPLSRLGGAGIGGGVTVVLQGDFYTTEEVAERFANEIARIIKNQIRIK